MRLYAPALVLSTVLILGASGTAPESSPAESASECERKADLLWDDPRWNDKDWSPLLPDAHRLVLAHRAVDECGARVRHIENTIREELGQFAVLDSAQTVFFDDGYSDVAPAIMHAEALQMRGRTAERLGRIGDSASYFFRATGLASRVDTITAADVYLDAAVSAQLVGRKPLEEKYLRAGEALLTDSLRRATSWEGRFAESLWGSYRQHRSSMDYALAMAETTPGVRAQLLQAALRLSLQAESAILRSGRTEDAGEHAAVLEQRARILIELGDLDEASRLIAEARGRMRAERSVQPEAEVEQAILEGHIAAKRADPASAAERYREAERVAARTGLIDHEAEALVALGHLEESQGQLAMAERAFRSAVAVREISRERTSLREWTASAFANRQGASRGLARVLLAQNDVGGSLAALDATRARAYHDLRRFRQRHRALTGDRRRRVDALVDSLEATRRHITKSEGDLLHRESDLVAYQDSLSDALGIEPIAATPLDLAALQSHLGTAQREVVAYQLGDSTSTAFVVTADTIAAVTLPAGRGEITRAARRMLSPWIKAAPDPAANLNAAHDLYRLIFVAVAPLLTSGRPLTIVPDGALAHVPFGMLTRAPSESYADADYLMRHHAITMELAVGLIGQTHVPGDGGVVVFGRSEFEGAPSETRGLTLGALPHVVAEVQSVGQHAARSIVALNADATESELERLAPTANVLHIATHAIADPELPMNSRVVLSADADGADDGQIHLYELQNRDLDADLVVLSGCATADGELQSGEGLMGMGYGVRVAGAASSIATLWAVDDRATVFLMDALYAGLADGLGKDEALRRAQLAYLDAHEGLEASPFFWAAPILSGAPEPISLGAPSGAWMWVLGIAMAGALAWALTRRTA